MRAYIHAFQGKPWNEECETAYRGFISLGVECRLFTTNEELSERNPEDIVVGGMLIMGQAFSELGIRLPNIDYPDELKDYTGRYIWTVKREELAVQRLPVFIKPVEEKAAKGMVVYCLDDLHEYDHLSPDAEMYCSEVVHFVSEWRCFIRYGMILGICFYNGDRSIPCRRSVVTAAIKDYKNIPSACSLDFGVTDDGRTLLIEVNDAVAIGCYGLSDGLYAKLLATRWAELTGTADQWINENRKGFVEEAMEAEAENIGFR